MPGLTLAWPGLHCNVHAGTGVMLLLSVQLLLLSVHWQPAVC
jgi:hypothetical protein